jgi:Ribonuclease HII
MMKNIEKEILRVKKLNEYENKIYQSGFKFIAGVDEVGRGPLAGPVYACAVILPQNSFIERINDSKKLSAKARENLDKQIRDIAIDFSIGIVDEQTIDKINIYNATRLAMEKAIDGLQIKPDYILTDAMKLNIDTPKLSLIKGDTLSISIAAASIIAKVARDSFMILMHDSFPVYNFNNNKGYGTKEHIAAIKEFGICPLHRKSFLKKILPGVCLV